MHQALRQGLPAGPERVPAHKGSQTGPQTSSPQRSMTTGPQRQGLVPECGPRVTCQLQAVFCPGSQRTPGQLPAKTMHLLIFQALSSACKADCIYLCPKDFLEGSVKIKEASDDNSLLQR